MASRSITGLDLEWADSFLVEDQEGPTTGGSPAANAIRPAGLHYDYSVTSNVAGGYAQLDYALTPSLHAAQACAWNTSATITTTTCWPATRTRTACRACRRVACTAAPIARFLQQRAPKLSLRWDAAAGLMLYANASRGFRPPEMTELYPPADRSDSFTNAAPKLSLRWDAATGLMLYANASRGFRPPEMTELYRLQRNQSVAELDSEQVDAYEIGLKFARGDWRGELAGFDMRKDNVILRDSNGFYVSEGRTSHEGVEYTLTWQALDALPQPSLARTPGIDTSFRAPSRAARRSPQATTWTQRLATCCVPRSNSGHRPRWPPKPNGSWWATTSSTPPMPIATPATNC